MSTLKPIDEAVKHVFKVEGEEILEEVVSLLQRLIRTATVNTGDGSCEEARNIDVLKVIMGFLCLIALEVPCDSNP
jgi:hypothetical protein